MTRLYASQNSTLNLVALYTYDAMGSRVRVDRYDSGGAAVGFREYSLFGGEVVSEKDEQNRWTDYVYANGKKVARAEPYNVYRWTVGDPVGTAQMEFDIGGNLLWKEEFLPFGQEMSPAGTTNRYKFTGHERDTESGLDYFGARYYHSGLGRFMSPDPSNFGAKLSNPQSWNMYSYGLNNPLMKTDPTGLYVCEDSTKCDSQNDKNFATALAAAKTAANGLDHNSTGYKNAMAAISSYGEQGVDNGVNVRFDANISQSGGVTEYMGQAGKTSDNANGQSINVTFRPDSVAGDITGGLTAHEGSHVSDASAWISSGFKASMNPTNRQTELTAFQVQFNITNSYIHQNGLDQQAHPFLGFPSGLVQWSPDQSFKAITPDLQMHLEKDYHKLDQPAFGR